MKPDLGSCPSFMKILKQIDQVNLAPLSGNEQTMSKNFWWWKTLLGHMCSDKKICFSPLHPGSALSALYAVIAAGGKISLAPSRRW